MAQAPLERRLAAILSADAVGYSRLMAADEAGTIRTLTGHRDAIAALVRRYRGRVVDAPGDNLLAELPTALEAVRCATEIQRALAERNGALAEAQRMEFRLGVHLGDVAAAGERIYGDGVNIAARLEALAEPGGVCISRAVHEQIESKLGLELEDLGEQSVKNMPRPVRVYAVPARALRGTAPAPDTTAARRVDTPTIAVLPFASLSADPEYEYFADGMTGEVIDLLSGMSHFRVTARSSSFAYKGRSPDVRQVARELNVRYVVEGSVRKLGARVRVAVQLSDADTGTHLWSERYDRPLEQIFEVQDEVTDGIFHALTGRVIEAERRRAQRRPPESLDAWALLLRAEQVRVTSRESRDRRRKLIREAMALDPDYPAANVLLAAILAQDVVAGFSPDPESDRDEARRATERGLALAESDPWMLAQCANVLGDLGDHRRSLSLAQRAHALAPSSYESALAGALLRSGRVEEAIERWESIRERAAPGELGAIRNLAQAYSLGGRYPEATGCAQRALDVDSGSYILWALLANALGQLDRRGEARQAWGRARELLPTLSLQRWEQGCRRAVATDELADAMIAGLRKSGVA